MKNIKKDFTLLTLMLLSSCATQPPAPIEYRTTLRQESYFNPDIKEEVTVKEITIDQLMKEKQVIKIDKVPQKDNIKPKIQNYNQNISNQIPDIKLYKPIEGKLINHFHETVNNKKINGINIEVSNNASDTKLKSGTNGTVLFAGYDSEFGNLIIIRSNTKEELYVAYAHLESIYVSRDENVIIGDIIGEAKRGGIMYIAVKKNQNFVDPLSYFNY